MAGFGMAQPGSPRTFEMTLPTGLTDPGDPAGKFKPNDGPLKPGSSVEDNDARIVKRIRETYLYERKVRQPHQLLWDKAIDRVNNHNPLYAQKQSYQSKRMLPVAPMIAFTYAWELQKQIELAQKKWFECQAVNQSWKPIQDIMRDLMMSFLHQGGAKVTDEFSTFVFDSVFMAICCQNMSALVLPENEGYADTGSTDMQDAIAEGESDPTVPDFGFGAPDPTATSKETAPTPPNWAKFGISLSAMHPRYVYLDSSNSKRGTYKLWTCDMKPGQFRKEAEVSGWINVDEVIAAKSQLPGVEIDRGRMARDKNETPEAVRLDTVNLIHFFGTLYDDDGEMLFENKYCIISGENMVFGPVDNPFWHGQIPIVSCGLLRKPFTTYHESPLTLNLDPIDSRVEVMNALLDYLNWAINPVTEVDWDQLHQQRGNQLNRGIYPGMLLHLQKGQKNFPALNRMAMQQVGSDVWQALGMLKQEWQEYLGMSGSAAMPRTRNRITATEAKERMAQAAGIVEQIFRNFQHNYLEPVLYQVYLLILQKIPMQMWTDFLDEKIAEYKDQPEILQVLNSMKGWNAKKRFETLGSVFRFRVVVYSASESSREMLEKLGMLAEAAAGMPGLAQRIKWNTVGEEYARALQLDPVRFLHPDEGSTAEQPYQAPQPGQEPAQNVAGVPNPPGQVPPAPTPH